MLRFPNEILDLIWLERCKLGFDPFMLQAKWIDTGHMRAPKFYNVQRQPFMTQLCRGARRIATRSFYSRVLNETSTGDGGFWWQADDVLYIDKEFYREMHPPHKSHVLGRDKITRVALDVQIDEDSTTIMELIADWFPNLCQVFFTGPALLFGDRGYPMERMRCSRSEGGESELTKLFPITTFRRVPCPKSDIPRDLYFRVQGITDMLKDMMPNNETTAIFIDMCPVGDIAFFAFDRDATGRVLGPNEPPNKDEPRQPQGQLTLKDVEIIMASEHSSAIDCQWIP